MKLFIISSSLIIFTACFAHESANDYTAAPEPEPAGILNASGQTLESRFNPPPGYARKPAGQGSYAHFLRQSPLKPNGAMVHLYNGQEKPNQGIYAAVLTYDVGTKDLQQCADAVMRLRAEYFFSIHQPEKIHFKLTNGFVADFQHWEAGYRLKFKGNHVSWVKSATPSSSHETLRAYLDVVYSYAGTLSLSRELQPVAYKDMKIGDVLILGGAPGHAVTVMDMAENSKGRKVYLLSQSYMPAQEIQILHNPQNRDISPWYELDEGSTIIYTPQWDFTNNQLMRFKD